MKIRGEIKNALFLLCFVTVIGGVIANEIGREVKNDGETNQHRKIAKTIQTEDGDIFDCIDIKSQPAFDHPLLKNHSILIEPSSYPIDLDGISISPDAECQPTLHSISCPTGTIPIWRRGKEHPMVNMKEVIQKIYTGNMTQSNTQSINAVAGLSRGQDIYGTKVLISVHDPEIYGTEDKSGGLTTIINGHPDDREHSAVGAGWFAWQSGGGDKAARFHIHWDDGGNHCFDLQCPGFVQTNQRIALGAKLVPISKYGGKQSVFTISIFKDKKHDAWWVTFGVQRAVIGYWPDAIFKHLKVKGTVAYWGGLVEGPTIRIRPPQMGSGHFASEGYRRAAFVKGIQIVTADGRTVTPSGFGFRRLVDHPKCYTVGNERSEKGGIYVNWGGPGDCRI